MKKILILVIMCSTITISQANENNMFNLLVKFTVKPGHFEEFKEACTNNLKKSLNEEGNIEMKLYVDDNVPNTIYVYSRWKDTDAYNVHKEMPYTHDLSMIVKKALQEPPVIMPLNAVAEIDHSKHANLEDEEETLFFIFQVKDEYRQRVLDRFNVHIENTHREKGNILFDLYTVEGDANTFVVYENWRNKSALWDVHMKQPYSEVTGALLNEAVEGELKNYMSFVTEIKPKQCGLSNVWKLDGFEMPESVVADPNSNWLYVTNIVNSTTPGFISRVSKDGKIDKLKWVEGVDQPCGLGIYNGKLYVGDQSKVHIIDIQKGEIIESLSAEGAMTLNDVAIDKNGKVFISDVMSSRIFTIKNSKLEVWTKMDNSIHPNGLYVDGKAIMVADLGDKFDQSFKLEIPGSVYRINIKTKKVELVKDAEKLGGLDGITRVGKSYIITNNSGGELIAISKKEKTILGNYLPGNADLGSEGNTVYIPNFAGTVTAIELQK